MTKRVIAKRIGIGLVAFLALIQLVPYGRSHANPAVSRAVRWDSPATAQLFAQACQDCHSNLTKWRWYDSIAPGSWLVQNDIDGGRKHLNTSEWSRPQPDVGGIEQVISGGDMPPLQYKVIHPGGRLSDAERRKLIQGFIATYKLDPPPVRAGEN